MSPVSKDYIIIAIILSVIAFIFTGHEIAWIIIWGVTIYKVIKTEDEINGRNK